MQLVRKVLLMCDNGHQAQDHFVRGLTKAGMARQLQEVHGASGRGEFRGRDMSGWYLQQVRSYPSPPGSPHSAAGPRTC